MADRIKFIVDLAPDARRRLESVAHHGSAPARKILHARVLLMSDQHHESGRYHDQQIAAALGLHPNTVAGIRKRFVQQGERSALDRKPRLTPPVEPKIDGRAEAALVALCCSPPPEGRVRWTLSLLRQEAVGRGLVVAVCRETIRKALEKNRLRPWRKQRFCIPERDAARFVAQMEEVLDLYAQPQDDDEPLICMDEAAKEPHSHVRDPLPMAPAGPLREDDKYGRHGTRAVFMFLAPLLGWRRAAAREHRTRADWAHEVRRLLDEDFPRARKIRLVCDNLNTHHPAALYEAFPPEEAHRLARRLDITYTPRNGSWLNIAEIELSCLGSQCLSRRIGDGPTLERELRAWNADRNRGSLVVRWQFTTSDARIKLRHLYPQL